MSESKPEKYEGWTILEREEWRPVVGYEGLYEVSDQGRVRRVGKSAVTGKGHGGGARIGRILKQQPVDGGYWKVFLWKNGFQENWLVHVLVAAAFIGPCPDGYEVNHENGNKSNNAASNLEYMTRSENNKHAYATGLRRPSFKLTAEQKIKARSLNGQGFGSRPIARMLGCCRQTVQKALRENAHAG